MSAIQQVFEEGDVVRFLFLHLATARNLRPHPSKAKHLVCEIEGKIRPMIVVRRHGRPTQPQKCKYDVLPLTHQGSDEKGGTKRRHEPVGRLAADENTFAILELHQYPAQLIVPHSKQAVSRDTLGKLITLLAYKGDSRPDV